MLFYKYSSYPFASSSSYGMNLNAAEFMQYLLFPFGPSSKRWPRCDCLVLTSVLSMPKLESSFFSILAFFNGRLKLGHPVPESYLSLLLNNGSPVFTSTYIPALFSFQYSLLKA